MLASILGLMSSDKILAVARRWDDECEEKRTNDGRRKSSQASPSLFSFCHILQGRKFHPRRPPEITEWRLHSNPAAAEELNASPPSAKQGQNKICLDLASDQFNMTFVDLRFIIFNGLWKASEKKLT